ncbi:MAG: TnpV protein, partial [Firmicutes bacterium]|nr:TnpV protein [Bacillota bacterium]
MERYTYDENNGLWYELVGDYYLPMVTVQQMDAEKIGIWGERRRRFLREHMKVTYNGMLLTGKLEEHLIKVNEVAEE